MKRKICTLIASLLILSSASSYAFAGEIDKDKFNSDIEYLKNVIYFVNDNYQYPINYDDIVKGLYDGFFKVLDEYSVYYTPDEYNSFTEDSAGEFFGIGVEIIDKDNQVVVVTPLQNSPAIELGVKAGDIIKYVNGKDVTGLSVADVSKLIKGPEGTKVTVGILRGTENITFDIIRRRIIISHVEGKILDGDIGYIKVSQFSDNSTELVKNELIKFDEKNIKNIVLDMRNNGGGLLNAAVDMLNLFVTEGPVVYVDYANGEQEVFKSSLKEKKYNIAVLVNNGSASATEIFAGAVKYKNQGIIVGTKTFGKGIVQSLYALTDRSGVKFTTAEYFSVNKTPVHKIGIEPDIVVENKTIDLVQYPKFSQKNKPVLGTVGLDVLSAEMILNELGYKVNSVDGVYDAVSFEAVKEFQAKQGFYPCGTIDFTTQTALYNKLVEHAKNDMEDLQLKTAIEQLKK